MRLNILTSFFLILSLSVLAAGEDFKVYYPKYRLPEELVSTAQGLMSSTKFSVMNSSIVIAGSPQSIKDALKLFKELDKQTRKFLVKFRTQGASQAEAEQLGVSANAKAGPVTINKAQNKSGVTATLSGVSVAGDSRSSTGAQDSFQTVEVMEGSAASIRMNGQNFTVRPRPLGNGAVQVELNQENGVSSVTTLPQKTWQSVGGVSETNIGKKGEILGKSSQESAAQKDFQLYVQETK